MRITTATLYDQARSALSSRRQEAARLTTEISTGKRIASLGDDPVGVRTVLREESALRAVESRRQLIGEADGLLTQGDDALASAGDAMQRVLEISVQLGNDTYSASDRRAAADELAQLRGRLVELGNTEVGGRRIFGGLASSGAAFDAAGVYRGDTGRLELPVGNGVRVEATLEGGRPFLDPAGGPGLFATLDSLEAALRADDGPGVRALVDQVRGAGDRIADARQAIGDRFSRLENVRAAVDRAELAATAQLEATRDTDLADAIVRLQESESGLRAALTVTARLDELSLTNFIR